MSNISLVLRLTGIMSGDVTRIVSGDVTRIDLGEDTLFFSFPPGDIPRITILSPKSFFVAFWFAIGMNSVCIEYDKKTTIFRSLHNGECGFCNGRESTFIPYTVTTSRREPCGCFDKIMTEWNNLTYVYPGGCGAPDNIWNVFLLYCAMDMSAWVNRIIDDLNSHMEKYPCGKPTITFEQTLEYRRDYFLAINNPIDGPITMKKLEYEVSVLSYSEPSVDFRRFEYHKSLLNEKTVDKLLKEKSGSFVSLIAIMTKKIEEDLGPPLAPLRPVSFDSDSDSDFD